MHPPIRCKRASCVRVGRTLGFEYQEAPNQTMMENPGSARGPGPILASAGQGSPGCLLVVDPEEDILEQLQACLEIQPTDVKAVYAGSPAQAIEISQRQKIKAIITEFKLPGMNGFELIQVLRGREPDICAAVMTAFADPKRYVPENLAENVPVLEKPFDPRAFIGMLKALMGGTSGSEAGGVSRSPQ